MCCGDAERGGSAGEPEDICGDVLTGERECLPVLGGKEPARSGVEQASELLRETACFEHLEKSQPYAVGGEQGKTDGGGFFAACEHGGEEPFGVGDEEDDCRTEEYGGEDDIHRVLYERAKKFISKTLTNAREADTIKA